MGFEQSLTPANGLIFRITHRVNVSWLLDHGLHSRSNSQYDSNFMSIGNTGVIASRTGKRVPVGPGGLLSDYVPFYFTPYSPMLLNIVTGRGVKKQAKENIVILVSQLSALESEGIPYVYTDRNAALEAAKFDDDRNNLADRVPWDLLQRRDFKGDPERPDKIERYMSEALVYRHLPVRCLRGIVVYNEAVQTVVSEQLAARSIEMKIPVRPSWFF